MRNAGYISQSTRIKNCITQILFIHLFNIYESLLGYAGRLFVYMEVYKTEIITFRSIPYLKAYDLQPEDTPVWKCYANAGQARA